MQMRPESTYHDARSYRRQKPVGPARLPWILLMVIIATALAVHYVAAADKPGQRPELRWGTPTAVESFKAGYVRGHCFGTHTVWVGEYLDTDKLADPLPRKGFPFHPDEDVPQEFRVKPADYTRSGFDRGHLANFADSAWSEGAAADSMLMSNMTPQTGPLNEGHTKWEGLESWVRDQVRDKHAVAWVFTGPAFLPDEHGDVVIHTLSAHAVWVPNWCWKTILLEYPNGNRMMRAYLMPNTDDPPDFQDCRVSVDALESAVGLNFWDAMDDADEDAMEADEPPVTN